TCSLNVVFLRSPACFNPSKKAGTRAPATLFGIQQVLSVLQTFRSRESTTVWTSFSGDALLPTQSHAPPVPWRLTGTPARAAKLPKVSTAAPEPRATARESL